MARVAVRVVTMTSKHFTRETLRDAVRNELRDAVSIAFDGCHKIYINKDESSHRSLKDWGYDLPPGGMLRVRSVDSATTTVMDWYENSCFLRFIQATRDEASQHMDVIGQIDFYGPASGWCINCGEHQPVEYLDVDDVSPECRVCGATDLNLDY